MAVPYRTPMFDKNGTMSREWVRFFDQQDTTSSDPTWTKWTPGISGAGMAVSGVSYLESEYVRVGPTIFFKFHITMTLGGTLGSLVLFALPVPVQGENCGVTASIMQPAQGFQMAWGFVQGSNSLLNVYPNGQVTYNGGVTQFLVSGFYRCA